jgi:tRNA-dihydrouridine synthase
MQIYMAPMEGITDYVYRNTFEEMFGGVDKYFTPFITPTSVKKFQTKELDNIDPEKNDIKRVVPQILTNNPDHFMWAAEEIKARGFKEVNLNLGCPSGTVVAKRKGSGLLRYTDELEEFLDAVFEGCGRIGMNLSLKTRLGLDNPDEFYELMDIYNRFPVYELTVHPRIRKDFYREPIRPEYFDHAYDNSVNPLVYNGDLTTISDILTCFEKYPKVNSVMIGRGLLSDPALPAAAKRVICDDRVRENPNGKICIKEGYAGTDISGYQTDIDRLIEFHDILLEKFRERLSGDNPVLYHMKDVFTFMSVRFKDDERLIKNVLKSKKLSEYQTAANVLFEYEKNR